ncbi:MAG: monovalent cation/H(+) antiporter subunit G [Actinomycetaceae bacterium]|nr:monovalent cation/H(+) antiporter subunit G [Actinomycetaceae bacterium]
MINYTLILDYAGAIFVLGGATFLLITGIGLLRFKDSFSRMHASAKTQWLAVFLLGLGASMSMRTWPWVAASLLMIALQTVSSPIGSQLVARAAYRNDEFEPEFLIVDDLADDIARAEARAITDRDLEEQQDETDDKKNESKSGQEKTERDAAEREN